MSSAQLTAKMLKQDVDNLRNVFIRLKATYDIDYIHAQEIENFLYRLRRDIDLLAYELSNIPHEHKHEW